MRLLTLLMSGLVVLLGLAPASRAATFGTVTPIDGAASDLVLDETRGRLYLVNSPQNRVEVYDAARLQLLSPIPTSPQPLSAAMAVGGKYLYVASYGASTLDVIDLDSAIAVSHISLPGAPEGVAVGGDGRVLITTAGTTSTTNNLLIYDPTSTKSGVTTVPVAPPAPTSALLAPTSGRVYQSSRSQLAASRDGRYIIGLNNPSTTTRQVFVFEVASSSVLRSRSVTSISSVLSVSPDGSKFMAGLTLFDSATLTVMAQQNAANSTYLFPTNVNFNTQQNQGGSVFALDGSTLYTAFNIAPVQTPAAPANVSQFMLSDPDNMLISLALQTPENLAGKMVITSDGATVYAISQSGFLTLPVSKVYNNPIAATATNVVLLASDQCGVTANSQVSDVGVQNLGAGQLTITATLQSSTTTTNTPALGGGLAAGGGGGAGGGGLAAPGLPIFVVGGGGPGGVGGGPGGAGGFPGGAGTGGATAIGGTVNTTTTSSTAPGLAVVQTDSGPAFQFTYNSKNAASLGTVTPHDFAVQSTQAINIPPRIRVYQNNRNAEAAGNLMPVSVGVSTSELLMDMVLDSSRHRLYIANSGLNRVDVFDTQAMQFLSPIKVGQLPHSLALTPDGATLYVANTGGESIGIIDPDQLQVVGKMAFPPIPFNASFAILTPRVIVSTQSGIQAVMSDGSNNTLWESIGNQMTPRGVNPVMGTGTNGFPATVTSPYSMAATPEGGYAILMDGNGYVYLYDASSDQYVIKQQVFSAPIQGYYGAIDAGPGGRYYLVNGTVLNSSLTPTSTSGGSPVPIAAGGGTVPIGGGFTPPGGGGFLGGGGFPGGAGATTGTTTTVRPISAVSAMSATTFARFVQPVRASTTASVTSTPTVEFVDATSGSAIGPSTDALEGPLATQSGTTRVNIPGRTMAVDSSGSNLFMLTATGLSVIPFRALPQGTPGQGGTGAPGGGGPPGGVGAPIGGGTPGGGTGGFPDLSFLNNIPLVNQNGVVNIANYQTNLAANSITSIFGSNLASAATSSTSPLPNLMGGACVTLNNQALPLILTSPTQINVQIPPGLSAGSYPLVVRSIANKAASFSQTVTISKYAPAVFVDPKTGQASIYHKDGSLVTKDHPATRDEHLVIYASGLGQTTGGKVMAGQPSPSNPLAVTGKVSVYFGPKGYSQAPMIVNWSGLTPGQIGTYEIDVTVPGTHMKGDKLPVTISVGGVDSPTTGANVPYVSLD